MSLKSLLAKPFAAFEVQKNERAIKDPIAVQNSIFKKLILKGRKTAFGKDHQFEEINTYEAFKQNVSIGDYEDLRPYIDRIKKGESNVLWPGMPAYFGKTSGTTSGTKYIPITKASINEQVKAARLALLYYIKNTGKTDFVNGKMIFIQGSPELNNVGGVPTGRLSGIVHHHVPAYLLKNRLPTYQTNCIEDWEEKVEAIVTETLKEDMTLFSGIPPWVMMYFESVLKRTGKSTIGEVFPNLDLYVHGGVNFRPYKKAFQDIIGKSIDMIETYPASEGFIAFQGTLNDAEGLLLNVNGGIFYEFIPVNELDHIHPKRIALESVELDKNYAIVLNTNAGLWGYLIGDTVKFTSKNPYRIKVTGRTKHFISAFGEHVIGEEVMSGLQEACRRTGAIVKEFTVAPQVEVTDELPYHEWLIEFEKEPEDLYNFRLLLDQLMCGQNIYYNDLIEGAILQPLKITRLKANSFRMYMDSIGKLGGQNKIPRLSDNRNIADKLMIYKEL